MEIFQADFGKTIGILIFILWIIFSAKEKKRKEDLKKMKERALKDRQKQPSPSTKPLIETSKPIEAPPRPLHQENESLREAEQMAKKAARVPEAPRGSDLEVKIEDLIKVLRHPQPLPVEHPPESHWTEEEFNHLQFEKKRLEKENKRLKKLVSKMSQEEEGFQYEKAFEHPTSNSSHLQSAFLFKDLTHDLNRIVIESEILAKPLALRRQDQLRRKWI